MAQERGYNDLADDDELILWGDRGYFARDDNLRAISNLAKVGVHRPAQARVPGSAFEGADSIVASADDRRPRDAQDVLAGNLVGGFTTERKEGQESYFLALIRKDLLTKERAFYFVLTASQPI